MNILLDLHLSQHVNVRDLNKKLIKKKKTENICFNCPCENFTGLLVEKRSGCTQQKEGLRESCYPIFYVMLHKYSETLVVKCCMNCVTCKWFGQGVLAKFRFLSEPADYCSWQKMKSCIYMYFCACM